MPRPMTTTQTNVGQSSPIVVDYSQNNFKVSLGAVISGGPTYTIQHTFDDILDPDVTPTWFNHDVMAALTVSEDGNYAYPIRAVRVNVTAVTAGTDSVTLTVIQGRPR